jgi:hypothetical protein
MSELWEMRTKEEGKEGNGQIFLSVDLRNFTIIK